MAAALPVRNPHGDVLPSPITSTTHLMATNRHPSQHRARTCICVALCQVESHLAQEVKCVSRSTRCQRGNLHPQWLHRQCAAFPCTNVCRRCRIHRLFFVRGACRLQQWPQQVLLQNVHIWVAQQPVCRQAGEGMAGGGCSALMKLAGAAWDFRSSSPQ